MIKGVSEDEACELLCEVIAKNGASWKDENHEDIFLSRNEPAEGQP